MKDIYIYDTTLRDGSQMSGINFSTNDKLKIVQKLNDLGLDFIEGGWPGSNPKDGEFFKKVRQLKIKSEVVAFSATCFKNKTPTNDLLLRQVLAAKTKWVTVFGKVWDLHTKKILKINDNQALKLISDTIKFLLKNKIKVIFDAEHFFDGWKDNPKFTLACLKAAQRAGAWNLTLCDTNGGTLPSEVTQIINAVKKEIQTPLGIHAHNDAGVAVANSLVAVESGVNLIQGTINGFGERVGNADLNTIIANLQIKLGRKIIPPQKLAQLTSISNFVFEVANLRAWDNQPFVGKNAFLHKGGIHANAVVKTPRSYEHIDPTRVGNKTRITISDLSGRSNVVAVAQRLGLRLSRESPQTRAVLQKVKELENQGFYFEAAEASFALLVLRARKNYRPPFQLLDYSVENKKSGDAWAIVKLKVGTKIRESAARGNGPVNALDSAARSTAVKFFPAIKNVELTDYKVRILDSRAATAAKTRVLIESSNGRETWTTVGCSENIIEASWQALSDSLEYAIWRNEKMCRAA